MTEKRDKVNVEDIIGLIKTDEPTNSVEEVRKLRGRETEKRFALVKCYNEQWGIVDKSLEEIDQLVLITTSKSGNLYLVNELNELVDENKQLKQQIQQLQHWNKCLAEKRHQELSYEPYTASKSKKELKELLEPKVFNCTDR